MAGSTDPPDWVQSNKGKPQSADSRAAALKQQAAERVDSQQVKQSAPALKPSPSGPMRAGADRQAHAEAMKKDDASAKLAQARQRAKSIQQKESQIDKGKDGRER